MMYSNSTRLHCLITLAIMLHLSSAASLVPAQEIGQNQDARQEDVAQRDVANDDKASGPKAPKFDREVYLESFDFVWQTIKDSHWDLELVGEPWDAAKDKYRPRMEQVESRSQALKVLNELLESLDQSHFGIIPAQAYKRIEQQEKRGGPGYSGLTVRVIDKEFVISRVEPKSPADLAGVKSGWTILSTERDGDVLTAEELWEESLEAAEHSVIRADTTLGLAARALVSGPVGEPLRMKLRTGTESESVFEFELVKGPGKSAKLGHLPSTHVVFESRPLADGVGYIRFNAFLDAPRLIQEFQSAISSETSRNGLVIDLRGNLGGLMILTMGMSGWFVDEPVALGTMEIRETPLSLKLNPRRPRYAAPVAILIDECTISAAEVMSGGLQDLGVARVFGSTSAGLVLPSVIAKLPSGDGFQYAMADYQSASGRKLEINGVIPDFPIETTKESWQNNEDPVLRSAEKWIAEQQ